ncbi:MAG: MFS transporter [Bacilli bacterium]|nr:MFS transporter [Bacilli bacterium]
MANNQQGKGFLNSKFFSSRIKSANVKLFPEAALGYLLGPIMALISNAIINSYLLRYYTDVMGLGSDDWAGSSLFLVLLQVLSAVIIVIGNLVVGKLMDKVKTKNGKARPLLIASLPLIALAIFSLFFAPFPWKENTLGILTLDEGTALWSMIIMAVGYNLYYAICYPFYYTSHSALVNLSSRNSNHRGLLATVSNGSVVAAAGLAGMAVPFFLNMLFVPATMKKGDIILPYSQEAFAEGGWAINSYDKLASYNNWKIFMIVLIVTLVIGIVIEFLFTRERITEEEFTRGETKTETKKVPMSKQIAVCLKDKYWWMVMVFFLLYQLGGMMKNNSATYFSTAWFGDSSMAGLISIIGAIPTAIGMVVVGIFATKFGKANTIKVGAFLAAAFGALSFVMYLVPSDAYGIISIASFVLKACGTVPAMYVSLALLADVLDHQEALYGFRTDGFSMAVYGSIMIAMTGIANGIIGGLVNAAGYQTSVSSPAVQNVTIWAFFGGEAICYLVIGLIFFFMNVEKFSNLDHKAIEEDQKAIAVAAGIEYVSAADRLAAEQAEAEAEAEEYRKIEFKAYCEKKGLDYEKEEAAFETDRAEKKAAADMKASQKEAAKKAKLAAMEAAMTEEQKAARAAKEAKKAEEDAKLAAEYEKMRAAAKASHLHI